jgi:diguanylate cyclase (GGDEF)-like protein/PAS domain S-box-containing protein
MHRKGKPTASKGSFNNQEKLSRWLLIAPVLCLCTGLGIAQAATKPLMLSTVSQARRFNFDAAHMPAEVHLRGVVTYFDTVTPNLFIQDQTGGIWVDLRGLQATPPRPGQLIELWGEDAMGFSPYIAKPRWKVLGIAPFPKPVHVSFEQASTTSYDSQWVEMEGIVRSFSKEAEGNILVMDVATPTGMYMVRVPDYLAPGFPMELVDAKVRFNGVCGASFNRRGQFVAMHLMMPGLANATTLEPAPADPFSIPATKINKIGRFSADLTDIHRLKVVGLVTARYPGVGLFLMDSTAGVFAESQDGTPVNPGDEVEVIGFPAPGSYSPVLKSASIRPTGRHQPVVPSTINGSLASRGGYDAQLVKITGTVEGVNLHPQGYTLVLLSDDKFSFEARLGDPKIKSIPPATGSILTLTGICSLKTDEKGNPGIFEIVLRDPADARLISAPPWLTGQRALSVLSILAILTAAVFVWVIVLRRRVRSQTSVIKVRLESELALEARYRRMFERNLTGLYLASVDGRILDCNDTFAHILGYADRIALLEHCYVAEKAIAHFHAHFYDEHKSGIDQILNAEQQLKRPDGSNCWVLANVRLVIQAEPAHSFIEGGLVDITDRRAAQDQVQFLAYYDSLTKLPNRSLLKDRLEQTLAAARRHKEKVAILFLDLDRFKDINDSLGHSIGDMLLERVGQRLRVLARDEDTVARVGGDEFLIVLTSLHGPEDAAVAAERIVQEMNYPFLIGSHSFNVGCSIGISLFPEHGSDEETLVKNADAAMYRAKESGRNAFRFYTEEMNAELVERLTLEHNLRLALERKELFLVYQPQMDMKTRSVIGLEALLRWQQPELGLVSPDRFIHVAELTGLIVPIGEWVLRSACIQARKWQEAGFDVKAVAVNVSAVQFRHDGFCKMVRTVLEETGLAPECLELELTEGILLSNADVIFSLLEELKSMGLKLAIDDFGTGYSSLSYLRQFPVSKLKIDRSFINDVATNADARAITAAIIEMGKALSLKVIAEGVETKAQLAFLEARHCDEVQGFLFSEPETPETLERTNMLGLATL